MADELDSILETKTSSGRRSTTSDYWECARCGERVDDNFEICWNCQAERKEKRIFQVDPSGTVASVRTKKSQSQSRGFIINRYLDLYRKARLLNNLGTTIKVVGVLAGIVIFIFSFSVGSLASQSRQTSPFGRAPDSSVQTVTFLVSIVVGGVSGGLMGGLFFLMGVLVSAQGQLLMAQADAAVHTSPFLTTDEKAKAMSVSL